jgi:DNA-binding response OmpR family regulator
VKATILVVDDSAGIRQMLSTLLTGAGYGVITADTFDHAKDEADYAEPDLLLIDIRLGDYNGLQLAIRERAQGRNRPLIVMSGHDDPVLVAEAVRLGAEYIRKPIDTDQLLVLIEQMLSARGER